MEMYIEMKEINIGLYIIPENHAVFDKNIDLLIVST